MYKVLAQRKFAKLVVQRIHNIRCLTGAPRPDEPLIPKKDEFPSRHIGPRDRDIITMLDTLGFKVRKI